MNLSRNIKVTACDWSVFLRCKTPHMKSLPRSRLDKQNDRNGWGDDMKKSHVSENPVESLALAGHTNLSLNIFN